MQRKRFWAVRLPKSRWASVGVSVAVLVAVAGMTLGVTTLLGVTFQGSGEAHQESGSPTAEGGEVLDQRDRLAICVEAVEIVAPGESVRGDPALEAAGKSNIEAALVEVKKNPSWDIAGHGTAEPVVDIGCPSPPLAVLGGPWWVNGRPNDSVPAPTVAAPSSYSTFVFIIPSLDQIDELLGSTRRRVVTQEWVSKNLFDEGPTLVSVTNAIYITSEEIQSTGSFLTDLLTTGARLPTAE